MDSDPITSLNPDPDPVPTVLLKCIILSSNGTVPCVTGCTIAAHMTGNSFYDYCDGGPVSHSLRFKRSFKAENSSFQQDCFEGMKANWKLRPIFLEG